MSREERPQLTVTFHRVGGRGNGFAWWVARRRSGGVVTGGYMPLGHGGIPHDLAHLATEGFFGIDDGFWGLLARGATFRRGTRQRTTRRGRAMVAANRRELGDAESLGNEHHARWMRGEPTPVGECFADLATQWAAVSEGETLTVEWPFKVRESAARRGSARAR